MEPGAGPGSFDSLLERNIGLVAAGQRTLDLQERGDIPQAIDSYLSLEIPLSRELEAATRSMVEAASRELYEANTEFDSKHDLLTAVIVSFSGLSVASALFLGLVMSWSFVRPVRQIGSALALIAAGDFSQRVQVSNRDEFGSLGADVNTMSRRLAGLYSDLEEANRSLEGRVHQSTDDLEKTYGQLVKSQQQVTTSEKLAAIGQMSAGVAHDLRNHLGAIKNATYIVGRAIKREGALEASDSKIRTHLDLIEDQVARSNRVINDLLNFTSVGVAVLVQASISDIIEEALGIFVKRDDVKLGTHLDPDLGLVMADGEQLQRVFLNLANNAQEAMPNGGALTVTGTRLKDQVRVSFADTGDGIPAENLDRIFDPLFTTKQEGTGLGLAVCREIVNKQGGTIIVTNDAGPDGGAVFTVTLPTVTI